MGQTLLKQPGREVPCSRGASLTLGLQLGQDGLGPTDGSRCEGLHALLRRVADGLDVGVVLLGGGVGCRHHVAGGADEGHVGHAVHHAGLLRERQLRWAGLGVGRRGCWAETQAAALSLSLAAKDTAQLTRTTVCSTKLQGPGPSGLHYELLCLSSAAHLLERVSDTR